MEKDNPLIRAAFKLFDAETLVTRCTISCAGDNDMVAQTRETIARSRRLARRPSVPYLMNVEEVNRRP